MAFTRTGLPKGGVTHHYGFQYDDSLQLTAANPTGIEPTRTQAVMDGSDADFTLMSGWFKNIALDVNVPIPVNITQNDGGAHWSLSGDDLSITIDPATGAAILIRYLLVMEMVETFMRVQGAGTWLRPSPGGWFGSGTEGSAGEGLSRFLAAQFLAVNGFGNPPPAFANSNVWLRSSRADFVNNIDPTDDGPDATTGCSLLFIYYLFAQLGFSINAIVAAAAPTLRGVYTNLTGDPNDPFPLFKELLDTAFPGTSTITGPNLDNPFPLGNALDIFVLGQDNVVRTAFRDGSGWHWAAIDGAAFNQGNPITAVRSGDALDIFILGQDNVVRTAFRDGSGWHWAAIEGAAFNQGNPITAVRSGDALDIFVLGQDNVVRTAFRDGSGWHWAAIAGAAFNQGNPITAVRNGDALDIFILGQDNVVRTAFRDGSGWHWAAIEGAAFNQGNPITAVRSGKALDIFVLGEDNVVRTAFRDGSGWHWAAIEGAAFHQGNPITAVRI
jgi:hypothetical protein